MSMIKIVSPSGWDFGDPAVSLVKIAANGLRGHDRAQFIKRAGTANIFLPFIDQVKFAADEEPVHLIALGASEAYGPNRNGDGFKEATLQRCHDTFTKFARWYRNHKNKDPNQSYGVVKMSAYNPVMRRVELLAALNKTAAAAERNGGFVADRELEKLASGDDIAVSMACRVPYDICSGCGNKARTREEYCKAAGCKYGGCSDNLTRLIKTGSDIHILHVDNESPTFFDISNVFRPADRIAYANRADWLQKAAADHGFFGIDGAKLAADMQAPLPVIVYQDTMLPGQWRPYIAGQIKLAHGLAAMEQQRVQYSLPGEIKRAFAADMQPDLDFVMLDIDPEQPTKTAAALGALADHKVIIPLRDFARLKKVAELAESAAAVLPGIYARMIDDGSLERQVTTNPYVPAEKLASARVRAAASLIAPTYSLEKEAVGRRCQVSAVRGHQVPETKSGFGNEKQAHDNPAAEELARSYAVYKLAALHRIAANDPEFLLTTRISCCQNQVI